MSRRAGRSAARAFAAALAGLLAGAGCVEPCPEDILPVTELLEQYNANARGVPRLWARVELSVTFADEYGGLTWRSGLPTGLLVLRKGPAPLGPHDFALIGRETASVELFRLGSSVAEGVYYFWHEFGKSKGAWFGRHAAAGAPGVKGLPVDPTQLLSVLAVCALPEAAGELPAVALGMQNTPGDCAYVLTYIDRQPVTHRILLKREVYFRWSKAAPPRPYKVNLLDTAGRRVMTAHLKDYRPIDVSDLDDPPDEPPVMPTDVVMVCNPLPGVTTFVKRIHLVLSEMTAADKWDPAACRFTPPAGITPVQVDRGAAGLDGHTPPRGQKK